MSFCAFGALFLRLTPIMPVVDNRRMLPPRRIPRIVAPSVKEFEQSFLEPQQPVVLTGLLADSPAIDAWSTKALRARFGEVLVPTLPVDDSGALMVDARRGLVARRGPLRDVMDELESGSSRSYMMARFDELPEAMSAEVKLPRYCEGAPWCLRKFWAGAAGTRSALHFDLHDNLHTVVFGEKRFTLFSPADRANLYPVRLFTGIPNASRVDWDAVDLERFPRVAAAQPWVCDLKPGETLFMPRSWWHHVLTVEPTVSVNVWWATGARLLVAAAAGTFKRLWGVSA